MTEEHARVSYWKFEQNKWSCQSEWYVNNPQFLDTDLVVKNPIFETNIKDDDRLKNYKIEERFTGKTLFFRNQNQDD